MASVTPSMSRNLARAFPAALLTLLLVLAAGSAGAVGLAAPPSAGTVSAGVESTNDLAGSLGEDAGAQVDQQAKAGASADLDAGAYAAYAKDAAQPVLDKVDALDADGLPSLPDALPAEAPAVEPPTFGSRLKSAFGAFKSAIGKAFAGIVPKQAAAEEKADAKLDAGAAAKDQAKADAKAAASGAASALPCRDPKACDADALDPCPALQCIPTQPTLPSAPGLPAVPAQKGNESKPCEANCSQECQNCTQPDPCERRNCSEPAPAPAQEEAEQEPAPENDEASAVEARHEADVKVEAGAPAGKPSGMFARFVSALKATLGL